MRSNSRGFTLLEVLVAIAILGLGLTSILSAQTGLFASSSYAERISVATGLVRCKMSEIELKLDREGYQFTDIIDEGPCCGDEQPGIYRCKWKIERVILPPPPTNTALSSSLGSGLGSGSTSGLGALGAIAAVGQSGGAVLGSSPGLGDISKLLAGGVPGSTLGGSTFGGSSFGSSSFGNSSFGGPSSGTTPPPADSAAAPAGSSSGGFPSSGPTGFSGTSALAPLVMSFVYPTLKPMLESSIRKITVGVHWKDGRKDRDLTVQQFVTNPVQGGLDPNAAQGLEGASQAVQGLLGMPGGGGATTPTTPTTPMMPTMPGGFGR